MAVRDWNARALVSAAGSKDRNTTYVTSATRRHWEHHYIGGWLGISSDIERCRLKRRIYIKNMEAACLKKTTSKNDGQTKIPGRFGMKFEFERNGYES
jgi:hypothetical protein